ncbi:carbohydrate ABC transporter permease [Anaeromyxobacter oryzae]|uniref:Sugar ABC transporter permease n=1 Tax=Anaeromyxobacter oryzae TaxID=2918170 RepID=A0ABM7X1R9_9BACT|nr:sugar ABC transporter permease [Anaeromyxobacter oryzae]BDG05734.1 sugar ABC transporter permease [Anaeromyxobacter oryzae]
MRNARLTLLLLAPALATTVLFVYLFIAWTGYASLTGWNQIAPAEGLLPRFPFVGLENYRSLFSARRFWPNDAFNTVVFTAAFEFVCLGTGLFLAILLDRKLRGGAVFRNVFLLPMSLSFVVTGTIWAWIFNPTTGINELLEPIGVNAVRRWLLDVRLLLPLWHLLDALRVNVLRPGLTTDSRAALGAVVLAAAWQMSGFTMAMFLAGLRGISDEVREAARVDGASEVQLYRHVLVPMLRPVVVSAVVILGYTSLKIFDLVFVMTRGGPGTATDFPSIYLFDSAFKGNQWARGAAVAMVMLLASAVVVLPYLRRELRAGGRA